MSLESATAAVNERVGAATPIGASVKFDFGDDGCILLDANQTPITVSNDDGDADCSIGMTLEDFNAMMTGEMDPTTAFMMGKLQVTGDMGVAMKLSQII